MRTTGAGIGLQIGLESTDFVFVLNDRSAVRCFAQMDVSGNGSPNLSVVQGPVGEQTRALNDSEKLPNILGYCRSNGSVVGSTFDVAILTGRHEDNEKLYGSEVTAQDVLKSAVGTPEEATYFMHVLRSATREVREPYAD